MPKSKPRRSAPPPADHHRRRLLLKGLVDAFRAKIRTYQAWRTVLQDAEQPTVADQAREAEFQLADAAFEGQLALALARGQLGPTLFDAVGANELPEALAHALYDHLNRRAQVRVIETPDGPMDTLLLGLVVHAEDAAAEAGWAHGAWRAPLVTALTQVVGEPVVIQAVPQLIHPLAWGQMILDQRLAAFDELHREQTGPGLRALALQDALCRKPGAPYPTAVRLQLVTLQVPVADATGVPVEDRLRQGLVLPAWGKFKAAVNSDTAWTEAPLMIEDALAYSLLHYLRRTQEDEVEDLHSIRLLAMDQVPNQLQLRLSFASGDQALADRILPFAWMGTTRQGMENTLTQLGSAWKT